jgi:nucleotide-binding universal stress UspA family protein
VALVPARGYKSQESFAMLAIRTILHPTDFSPLARHAFEVACSLARDYKARLVLLHVHEPPVPMGELVPPEPPDVRDSLLRELQELKPAPDVDVEYRLEIAPVAEGILRAAGETECDLIVLGTHGRRAIGRMLLGSVAESVLRKAPCMVLTVKGESRERA